MNVVINIIKGAKTGQRFEFKDRPTISVGRGPTCDVAMDPMLDTLASTNHAEIRVGADGSLWYVDNNSSNGSGTTTDVGKCRRHRLGCHLSSA